MADPQPIDNTYSALEMIIVKGHMTTKKSTTKKSDKGYEKNFIFTTKWQNATVSCGRGNGSFMITGKKSGIIAIDIDNTSLPHNEEIMRRMADCNMVQKTKKGFHYIYRYNERILTRANTELALDTRGDGGGIFCEPSIALSPDGDVIGEWKWISIPHCKEELCDIPEDVIEYLAELGVELGDELGVELGNVTLIASSPAAAVVAIAPLTENILMTAMRGLKKKRWDDYASWIKLGMICYKEGLSCADYDSMSQKGRNYNAGAIAGKWNTFSESNLTQATVWRWLKEDNKSLYGKLMSKSPHALQLIHLLNHKDVAEFFYEAEPDSYLWSKTLGWYTLRSDFVWDSGGTTIPSQLKRSIATKLQTLIIDVKFSILDEHAQRGKGLEGPALIAVGKECEKHMKAINGAYKITGSSDFCNGVISFLTAYYERTDLETLMDSKRHLFPFTDVVYDLDVGAVRPIEATDYISITTGYKYPKACPSIRNKILDFIYTLFECEPTRDYLISVLSSCVSGHNRWEEFYTLTGEGGNGKGAIAGLMQKTFGNFYKTVDMSLFTKLSDKKDQPLPALVDIRNARIVMATEPEKQDVLQIGILKKVSGGDTVEARTLYSPYIWKYVPPYKLFFQLNGALKLSKLDDGVSRRTRIINFPFSFKSADKMGDGDIYMNRLGDPDVKLGCEQDSWRDEMILILLERWQEIKIWKSLPPPSAVAASTGEYLSSNNPVKGWLNEFYDITKDINDKIASDSLLTDFITRKPSESKIRPSEFKSLMMLNGIQSKRETAGNFYLGLRLKVFA